MSRYIEVDDVANAIYHHFPSIRTMADAKGIIEEAPNIDIVFCKECKYAHMTYGGDCKYCDMWKDDDDFCIELYLDGDFYCAYGERKESE